MRIIEDGASEVNGRPLRADARRSRDLIIGAAQRAFRIDGPNASLERIASDAGVGSATLHRHFPGRESLLAAVFAATVDRFVADAAATEHSPNGYWGWLERIVRDCAADDALGAAIRAGGGGAQLWAPLIEAARPLHAAAPESAAEFRVEELLALVDAIASTFAGHPDRAGHMLAVVRRGLGGSGE
ncbi:TetR/AcrR family transcriptional regulator [Williamsia sterculiae]|uniref:Transcriptional regulator, TetR family n=1 Tax=Williamsia sterculiae TaxID=1344003 RepID=A0A1N7H0X7_9NOCA|nr:TetR/AcrR family transcriptional regulator [Williamsia sterculiae]SIS18499.1 transcriptional regulator, TetR family [Williamsia sterculiae]